MRFLYLSPYFPPDARVGALRPLKFVRHLPELGVLPVVLADAPRGVCDERLLEAVPADVPVVHDYGLCARARWRRQQSTGQRTKKTPAALKRLLRPLERPELVPLGPHAFDIPHALASARRLLEKHQCEVILVNADPFAAALVGALLSRLSGVPLVVDFRDPWALCTLRRPLRKPWVARSVDALERFVVGAAQRVILNTEAARRTYAAHYRDLGGERFACIPNHADPSLHRGERPPPRQRARFELLFAGTLRRFVEGEVLLDLLSELRERGFEPKRVGLSIVGSASDGLLSRALERGLGPYLSLHEPVSYLDVPARQQRADLLVVLGHRDAQRIPAKIYDAALSDRPVLVVSSSPELSALTETIGGARAFAHQDVTSMADWVSELVEAGGASVKRDFAWDSRAASARLATVLRAAASRSVA